MFQALMNVWKVRELRNKVLFTLGLLCIYRIGFYVPLPGVDQERMGSHFSGSGGSGGMGQLAEYFAIFTGGDLQQSTIFGLGIMPYISASIIFQLLVTVVPALEKLHREGESGRKKIQEYTRYATVGLCFIQAWFWLNYMSQRQLVYPDYVSSWTFWGMGIMSLITGTVFLMWLGEQIDEYGIGNGISLIIMAGIVARIPDAIIVVATSATLVVGGSGDAVTEMGPSKILFLVAAFVGVVAGSILITQGQRRIPIQQAKQQRGRRMFGGQRQFIPLRVNHGGVMPIIFASSLMIFPALLFEWLYSITLWGWCGWLTSALQTGTYLHTLFYIAMVYFFAYFWTTVQFQPKEMANQLRDYGSFIPGLRPGKRTADYLERVMERITYVGAAFLAVIAVIPAVIAVWLEIPFRVSAFLGGTGLLIVVSVALDLVQRIEANLVMRNYGGFLGGGGTTSGGGG
jgi:preprotein translocase subunit SecY